MRKKNTVENSSRVSPVLPGPCALELITTEALAAMIHWHPESVRRACRQGRIQAVKLGRGWRMPPQVTADILKNGIPTNSN
jgi:hypothetical protein